MNSHSRHTLLAALSLALCASAAWPQAILIRAEGRLTNAGKPVPQAQVVLIQQDTFKTYKAKTNEDGTFSLAGLTRGRYTVEIFNASGDILYRKSQQLGGEAETAVRIDIELSGASPRPAPSAEPSEPSKPPRDETTAINALISKYNSALAAQDWPAAITALKAIVAADPTRWDFYEALGNAQFTVGDYQNAAESFDKGIKVAQQFLATSTSNDPIARSDRDRVKAATGQMLINQGNAYLKLKKNDEAIAAYTKAAELVPDPAVAYFNLCVMHYNTGKLEGALDACDKAIAANPNRADAYFIKGSLLVAASKMDKNGKVKAPPGTAETLRKYLELAPQGAHANDVRQLLEYIGAKADSSATSGKRPES